MNHTKPEGCNAAVTTNWDYDRGTYRLTARMVCGERNNVVGGSFIRRFMDQNNREDTASVEREVSGDVTTTLGAMCLGCPHNRNIVQSGS